MGSLGVDEVELHGEALAAVDRDGLMVDNGEEVLVGGHGDDDSVKGDGFELIAQDVKYLDGLVISHCHPIIGTCNPNNILPLFFPRITVIKDPTLRRFQKLHSILGLIGICYECRVNISE